MENCQVMLTWSAVELGISGNRKYFLKMQAVDSSNLEESSGLLINIHKTASHPLEDAPIVLGLSAEAGLELIQAPSCLLPWQWSNVLCIVTGMLGFVNKVLCKGLHVFGRNNSAFFFTLIILGAVSDLENPFLCLGLHPWAFLEGTSGSFLFFCF